MTFLGRFFPPVPKTMFLGLEGKNLTWCCDQVLGLIETKMKLKKG